MRGARATALAAGLGYLGVTAAVAAGLLDGLDAAASRIGGGSEEWRTRHPNLQVLVDSASPHVLGAGLVLLLLTALALHRRPRPVVVAAATLAATAAVLLATKELVARPGVYASSGDGAYPSGHVTTLVVYVGLALMAGTARPRAWHLVAAAAAGTALGGLLLVVNMHWASDSLGGILLGVALLAVAAVAATPARPTATSQQVNPMSRFVDV